MNILLTGGSGFIGSNLSKELLKNDENRLIIVDNLLTGSLNNLESLLDNENVRFVQHDVQDHLEIEEKVSISSLIFSYYFKINKIRWLPRRNAAHFLLSTNDKTIKLWKVNKNGLIDCN